MSWIKLVLHPDDPKVSIVASDVGASKVEAYAAMVRWLFWLDENYSGEPLSVSPSMFKAATGWPNDKLAQALRSPDVDWLTDGPDGRIAPTRPDSHFSSSAKRRATESSRKAVTRRTGRGQVADAMRTPCRQDAGQVRPRGEEKREEKTEETHTPPKVEACVPEDRNQGGLDPRLLVLTGVGISFGVAQKLIRDHDIPLDRLEQYVEMASGDNVNNRAAYIRAAISGGYAPKQAGNGKGKSHADQRRAARAADEFPEHIVLPTS
jgi:hypothetical protein